MRYLFFDIECCDGSHICEFGYVLTDEKFRILEKREIPINPELPFLSLGGLKLAHPKSYYKAAKGFDEVYAEIGAVLNQGDEIFGFAADNDVDFLRTACMRYGKKTYEFTVNDVQLLYRDVKTPDGQVTSLEKAATALEVEMADCLHKSDDDALLTMRVAKALSKETGMPSLLARYPLRGYRLEKNDIVVLSLLSQVREALKKANESNDMKGERRFLFKRYMRSHGNGRVTRRLDKWSGKSLCSAIAYENSHFRELLALLPLLESAGIRYETREGGKAAQVSTDWILARKEDGKDARVAFARSRKGACKEVTPQELFALLGTSEEALRRAPFPKETEFCLTRLLNERGKPDKKVKKEGSAKPVKKSR